MAENQPVSTDLEFKDAIMGRVKELNAKQQEDVVLKKIGVRPRLTEYVSLLWRYRHFIIYQSHAKAFSQARKTQLGRVWLILVPFLSAAVFYVIFGFILNTSRGIDNFVAYLTVGVSFFGFMQQSLTGGGGIIQGNKALIRAFTFPRVTLVFSQTIQQAIDFIPLAIATLLFLMVMPPHIFPSWHWLLIIPIFLIMFVFSLGIALITAKLTAYIGDLRHVWPLLGRFWFYGSGIFFSLDRFQHKHLIVDIMRANPGYQIIEMFRDVLIYQQMPPSEYWIYTSVVAVIFFLIGFLSFWRSEEFFGNGNL